MTVARLFMVLSTRIAVPAKKSRRFIIRISYNCQPTNECGCPENVSLTPVNSASLEISDPLQSQRGSDDVGGALFA
jgi:hypothetical protein